MQIKYDIDKKGIGKRLKGERERNGLMQEKLAERMEITSKYLSKIENGAATPSLAYILKFNSILQSDLNYLLRGFRANEYGTDMVGELPLSTTIPASSSTRETAESMISYQEISQKCLRK